MNRGMLKELMIASAMALLFAIALIAVAVSSISPSAAGAAAADTSGAAPSGKMLEQGKAMWEAKCSLCHGFGGVPKAAFAKKGAPNMTDPAWQSSKTDDDILTAVREGKAGTLMQPYGEKLNPAEIQSVVAHIRTFKRAAEASHAGEDAKAGGDAQAGVEKPAAAAPTAHPATPPR